MSNRGKSTTVPQSAFDNGLLVTVITVLAIGLVTITLFHILRKCCFKRFYNKNVNFQEDESMFGWLPQVFKYPEEKILRYHYPTFYYNF